MIKNVCCRATIAKYIDQVWPIEGPTNVQCVCGLLWTCRDDRWEAKEPVSPRREEFMARIAAELDRAYAKHGREPWSRHEFYAIILEEFEEMWDDIKADRPLATLDKEIVQVAAMCFRYFETRVVGP